MTGHSPRRSAPADGTQATPARGAQSAPGGGTEPVPALLIAAVRTAAEADQALAAGADLIDAEGLDGEALAALRARHPGLRLWHGSPAAADADRAGSPAAAIATASVLAWLGTPAIRTRHVLQVRRAIDMTCSIAGTRLPVLTIRGLA
jgi:hypothetical protein